MGVMTNRGLTCIVEFDEETDVVAGRRATYRAGKQ
jgi:hypothetical protein